MKNILTESYRFPESGYNDKGEYIDEDELYQGYERDAESTEDKLYDKYGANGMSVREDPYIKAHRLASTMNDKFNAKVDDAVNNGNTDPIAEELFAPLLAYVKKSPELADADDDTVRKVAASCFHDVWRTVFTQDHYDDQLFTHVRIGDEDYTIQDINAMVVGGIRIVVVSTDTYEEMKELATAYGATRDDMDDVVDYPSIYLAKGGLHLLDKRTHRFYLIYTPQMVLNRIIRMDPDKKAKIDELLHDSIEKHAKRDTNVHVDDDLLEPDTEVDPYVYGGNGEKYTHNSDELYNDFADEEELRKVAAESIMDQKMAEYFHALGERTGSQVVCEAALNIYREITKAYRK